MFGACRSAAAKARSTAAVIASARASSTSAIAEPPNPPPVIRAPCAPAATARVNGEIEFAARDLEVVAHRRVRLGEQRADRPDVGARLEQLDDAQHAGVLGDDVPRSAAQHVVVELLDAVEVRVAQRRDAERSAARAHSSRRAAYSPSASAWCTRVSMTRKSRP